MAKNDPKGMDSLIKRVVTRELRVPKDKTAEPTKLLNINKIENLGPLALLNLYDRLKEDYGEKTIREKDYTSGSAHAETSEAFRVEKKNLAMVRGKILRHLKQPRLQVL